MSAYTEDHNVTIAELAAEYDMEPHAVKAALDLGSANDTTAVSDIDGWTDSEARQALAMLAEQTADRT